MFYHVGEWSRVIARDYRHHPSRFYFYLCFDDTTFSLTALAPHRNLVRGYQSRSSYPIPHPNPTPYRFISSRSFHDLLFFSCPLLNIPNLTHL